MEVHFDIPFDYLMDYYYSSSEILNRDASGDINASLTSFQCRSIAENKYYDMKVDAGAVKFKTDNLGNVYTSYESVLNGSGAKSLQKNYSPYQSNDYTFYMIVKNEPGTTAGDQRTFFGMDVMFLLTSTGGQTYKNYNPSQTLSQVSSSEWYPPGVDGYNWRVIMCVARQDEMAVWSNAQKIYASRETFSGVPFSDYFCVNRRFYDKPMESSRLTGSILEQGLIKKGLLDSEISVLFEAMKRKYNLTSY